MGTQAVSLPTGTAPGRVAVDHHLVANRLGLCIFCLALTAFKPESSLEVRNHPALLSLGHPRTASNLVPILTAAPPQIECRGRGESPQPSEVSEAVWRIFMHHVWYPDKYVLLHCTHGFNRTGERGRMMEAMWRHVPPECRTGVGLLPHCTHGFNSTGDWAVQGSYWWLALVLPNRTRARHVRRTDARTSVRHVRRTDACLTCPLATQAPCRLQGGGPLLPPNPTHASTCRTRALPPTRAATCHNDQHLQASCWWLRWCGCGARRA